MNQKLKSILFSVVVVINTIAIYVLVNNPLFRYLGICYLMIVSIELSEIILGEEPLEFFDNFSNYKKARVSSVLMLITLYSSIRVIICIFQWILWEKVHT